MKSFKMTRGKVHFYHVYQAHNWKLSPEQPDLKQKIKTNSNQEEARFKRRK